MLRPDLPLQPSFPQASIRPLCSMTRYRHTLQIILRETSCREKVEPPPLTSLLCSLHKINFGLTTLMQFMLVSMAGGSEAQQRTAALLPRSDATSLLSDVQIESSLSFLFFSRKQSFNLKEVTVHGWLVLILSQGALEETTTSKKLSTLRRSRNKQDTFPP